MHWKLVLTIGYNGESDQKNETDERFLYCIKSRKFKSFLRIPNLLENQEFHFEELETRALLSGNVTVAIASGDLVVTGDSNANEIRVFDNQEGGLVVRGLNGTQINGSNNGFFNTAAVEVDDVRIDLNNGNDSLTFRAVNFRDDLTVLGDQGNDSIVVIQSDIDFLNIQAGLGADFVALGQSNARVARVLTGDDPDRVTVRESFISVSLTVDSGIGDDEVQVERSRVGTSGLFLTGDGNDEVSLDDSTFRTLRMELGDQQDTALIIKSTINFATLINGDSSAFAPGGDQDKILFSSSTTFSDLTFNGGEGDDIFIATNGIIGRNFNLRTHNGEDTVRLTRSSIGNRTIVDLGEGNDRFLSEQTQHEGISSFFGRNGNDTLLFANVTLGENNDDTSIIGGSDDDTIYIYSSIFNGDANIQGQGQDDSVSLSFVDVKGDLTNLGGSGEDTYSNEFVRIRDVEQTVFEVVDSNLDDFDVLADPIRNVII